MSSSKNPLVLFGVTVVLLIAGALGTYYFLGSDSNQTPPPPPPPLAAEPDARTFCEQNGGVFEIKAKADGTRFDACIFHGFECDAGEFQSGTCVPDVGPKG